MRRGQAPFAVAAGALIGVGMGASAEPGGPVAAYRAIDGTGNNQLDPLRGAAQVPLLRLSTVGYADGVATPAGADRPSARAVSNVVCSQSASLPNLVEATDYLWQWGQFLDHDVTAVETAMPLEPFDIEVPLGDPWFDPGSAGGQTILVNRTLWDAATGTSPANPRQQVNFITAYVDASNVYGSDGVRAAALRTNDGTGRLRTSHDDLLPFNTMRLPNAGGPSPALFVAGDVRANEQSGLTAMHTLFMREHNRLATELRLANPTWTGDRLYEESRARVGALMQVITYREFLPLLLGDNALPPYAGYQESVDAGIANAFATAAYRIGHTLLPGQLMRLEADGSVSPFGHLPLRDAFFDPGRITNEGGIEPLLRGLAAQPAETVDARLMDDVRNFLFGAPTQGGFDLASLNIQRGREHGLPSYNQLRIDFGLPPALDFNEVSSDPEIAARLATAYTDVDQVDAWVGAIAEDHAPGSMVGDLIHTILVDQFTRLREGDRFWYELMFFGDELAALEATTLADVIRRNTPIGSEIQDDVFRMAPCFADVDADGLVDVTDLVAVVLAFGTTEGPADVNGDGVVDVVDIIEVVLAWGPC